MTKKENSNSETLKIPNGGMTKEDCRSEIGDASNLEGIDLNYDSNDIPNINERLTNDKITATRIKRENGFTNLVVNTWEPILEKERALPPNWTKHSEVLVGRTA